MINTVNSFEEASRYPVMFNSAEWMMDNNKDVFYVKSVDSIGKVTVDTYKFEKIENEKPLSPDNFVTREQFDSLVMKLDRVLTELGGFDNGK